jgi:hypothetical protein
MKISQLLFGCFLALTVSSVMAQQGFGRLMELGPARCHDYGAFLDVVHQGTAPDQLMIVIARLGDGDIRSNLNLRRLENVRAYWTKFLYEEHRRKPETIILAEGERVAGHGRLEFYVGGKLVGVLKVSRNADLYIGECYPPDDSFIRNGVFNPCEVKSNKFFYPCRAENARRKGKRQ